MSLPVIGGGYRSLRRFTKVLACGVPALRFGSIYLFLYLSIFFLFPFLIIGNVKTTCSYCLAMCYRTRMENGRLAAATADSSLNAFPYSRCILMEIYFHRFIE